MFPRGENFMLCFGIFESRSLYGDNFLVGLISDPGAGTWDFSTQRTHIQTGILPSEAMLPLTGPGRTGSPSFNLKFTNVHIYNSDISLLFKGIGNSNNGSDQAPPQP